jgi:hypothetical protein
MSARREFLHSLLALAGAAGIPVPLRAAIDPPGQRGAAPAASNTIRRARADVLVGVQMGPHTMLDEGIEPCLDLCRETADIDTLFTYSHAYGGDLRKPIEWLATDHGKPPIDQRSRTLPLVYVKHHEQYFKNTTLRHQKVDSSFAYANRDLFAEMITPLRARGMKIYARILESGSREVQNVAKVATVNVHGRPTRTACWNHPEYKAFWNATAEDLFRSYELDGFQWGAERASPLARLIQSGGDDTASCFCQFCLARGKARGIDADRARKGFEEALGYVQRLRGGASRPPDGAFAEFFRMLMRYPEILAWDYQYRLSREEIMKGMFDTIKAIKPAAQVGWHVDHWATSMDFISRAAMSYAEMAVWSDYLKVVVYHAVTAPRMRSWVANEQRSIYGDMPLEDALNLHYALFGYDRSIDALANEPTPRRASPEYVYAETKRSVDSAQGKTRIYPGIGFNLPGGGPDDPPTIARCVTRALDAGARGIVVSREYEELTLPNMKAVGGAIREATGR